MYLALVRRKIGLGIFGLGIISSFVACSGGNAVSELDDVFLLTENVRLKTEGLGIHSCGALCVDRSSRIYLLDPIGKRIFVYEQSGDLISTLGGPGDGPGEFSFPGAAELNLLDDLFVMDIFRKRINIFNLEGGLRDSLLLTGTQSQISDVRITSGGSILASGFTRISSDNPEYGNWITRYDAKGKYLNSFFPSNENNRNWAWRISPGCLFDIDLDDNIYAIQHCDYRIEKYDGKGNILARFGSPSVPFVHPNTRRKFNTKGFASRSLLEADLRAFASSWTRIIEILVIRNRYVLIVLEMNGLVPAIDSKYIIDIWDRDGRLVRGRIQSDMRLICKDPHDVLYFLNEDGESGEPSCRISKYVLRIDENE